MSSTDPTTEKPVPPRTDSRPGLEEPLRVAPKTRAPAAVSRTDAIVREPVARTGQTAPASGPAEPPGDLRPEIASLGTFGPDDPLVGYLAALLGLGRRTGDYLKGLASWRLIEAKGGDAAGEPDPLWVAMKKFTTWGLTEDRREGPFRVRRNSPYEDPILEWFHQVEAYLKSLELFKPGAAVVEYQQKTDSYFNRLGSVLKDAASWRGSTLRGLISWKVVSDEAAPSGDSIRGSLQGFVDLWRRSGDSLKGFATWHVTDSVGGETARDPDPLLASLKSLALWRVSLKDLATWRFTETSDAAREPAIRDSSQDQFAGLWSQAGDYLKGLATWRVTEGDQPVSDPNSLWNALKNLASWRLPEERKEANTSLVDTAEPYKFDVLTSALTRNEVRGPQ